MSQTTSSTEVTAQTPPEQPKQASAGLGSFFRRGDLGQLPVLIALVVIVIFFTWRTGGIFFTPRNLTFMVLQTTVTATVALGAVLVLLIGEIDLSLAAVSSVCGAVLVTLSVYHGFSAPAAVIAALATGALIGLVNGFLVAVVRVPSFIVTLAGLIFYSGLLLHLEFPQTTIRLTDESLTNIAVNFVPDPFGWLIPFLGIALWAGLTLYTRQARIRSGLSVEPISTIIVRVAIAVVAVGAAVLIFESYFGIPEFAAILMGLIIIFWLLLRFTSFGKHVYAVGGNAEASRRAGIRVTGVRIMLFTLASTLAAVAGILEAARSISVSTQVDPTLLLEAIAAAVIGGVSLFGGRGSIWAVVVGGLVIGCLKNGLTLLSQTQDVMLMVEGAVLIVAVISDALLRRRNAVTGR